MNLRYFNVAGAATPELGDTGVFNLIPMVFERLQAGERPRVFGGDYPTPDGTCVRDYVHVADLARAHVLALRALPAAATPAVPGAARIYNLGNGSGYSVRQVIAVAEEVTGRRVPARVAPRRPGDPAVLVAGAQRIQAELGWHPRKQDLRVIVEDAWRWLETHGRY